MNEDEDEWGAPPLDPPCDPLHPLHLGKTESELRFYPLHDPLQTATEALHFKSKA